MSHRIGIGDLEASFLEVVAVVEFRATDKEGALGVDHDVHSFGGDEDVSGQGAVDQVHLVLETGASATDDSDAKSPVGTSLFREE